MVINTVAIVLNNTWTTDKIFIPLITRLYLAFYIIFWIVVSVIFFIRKAKLKHEYFYFIGLGLWNIIMTIEFHQLQILEGDLSTIVGLAPYAGLIVLCLLPIKKIWKTV